MSVKLEEVRAAFHGLRARSPIVDVSARIASRPRYALDTVASGYIALRIFVLLFPVAYVVVAAIGLTTRQSATAADVTTVTGVSGGVADSVASASHGDGGGQVLLLIVGIGTVLWAARSLLKALRIAHAIAWRLPDAKYKAVEMAPLLVAGGLLASVYLGLLALRARQTGSVPTIVAFLVHGGVVALLWFFASRALPHPPCSRWYHVPGAVLVGLGMVSLNFAVTVYFVPKLHHAAQTYGVLGIGLVLITYLLLVGWMIVLSAELNAGIFETATSTLDRLPHEDVAGLSID